MTCELCKNQKSVNWKDAAMLRDFISPQAKILRRKKTHLCAKHQRRVARAIKRARIMAILPFVED